MIKRNVFIVGALTLSSSAAFAGGILDLPARTSLVFGDATVNELHTGIWVGGNLTQSGSTVAGDEYVNPDGKSAVFRVGKDLFWNTDYSQSIKNGNVWVGGGLTNKTPNLTSGYSIKTGVSAADLAIPSKSPYAQLSSSLMSASATSLADGNALNNKDNAILGGTAYLNALTAENHKGAGTSNVFVYDFTSRMGQFSGVNFSGFTSTDTLIFNVDLSKAPLDKDGKRSLNLGSIDVSLNNINPSQILWNFQMSGGIADLSWTNQLAGSVLAPNVDVTYTGNLMGQVVSDSLSYKNGELHASHNGSNTSFNGDFGDIPTKINAVPEPFSMSLLAAGVGLYVRRRTKKS